MYPVWVLSCSRGRGLWCVTLISPELEACSTDLQEQIWEIPSTLGDDMGGHTAGEKKW